MKFNKYKKLKGLSIKGSEGFLRNRKSDKRIKNKFKYLKSFIALCTLIIIPILNILPSEIIIFNNVTHQNIQTINVNYELEN